MAVGWPHHMTQRGNNRRDVFYSDADRALYLELLQHYCQRFQVAIEAYCLMSNHVHLVAVPLRPDSLAKAFGRTHNDYARLLNIQRRESGHVWQNRFFSCAMDGYHLWQTMRYVELNPVRAGMVARAEQWPWSTAAFHLGQVAAHPVVEAARWSMAWDPARWAEGLESGLATQALADRIRESTRTGRPLGSEQFVQDMEQYLQRPLQPQKRGPHPATKSIGEQRPNYEVA